MNSEAKTSDALLEGAIARLSRELRGAVRRRPSQEAELAGAVRALAPFSPALRRALLATLEALVHRESYTRPLYAACVRTLAEQQDVQAATLIAQALDGPNHGGLTTLSAACFSQAPELTEPLSRAAGSRHAVWALAAEVARVSRHESDGARFSSVAAKIKESHRIALCSEVFVPLLRGPRLALSFMPTLGTLRAAERHLGRWLILAELSARAGDPSGSQEARRFASTGLPARDAWEGEQQSAVRAMLHLCRDYAVERYRDALRVLVSSKRTKPPLRALSAAALYDAGEAEVALHAAKDLAQSRHLSAFAWASCFRSVTPGCVSDLC